VVHRRTEEESIGATVPEPAAAGADDHDREAPRYVDPLSNEERAFLTLLFNKYRGSLYRYLSGLVRPSEDVAELVQETYFRIMRHVETVRFESVARAYLFRTATNVAREYYRRRMRRQTQQHVGLEEAETLTDNCAPDQDAVWHQATSRLKTELLGMPEDLREILIRYRFQEQTCPEIALSLGVSTRTVERRLSQAMELLSQRLRGFV
jgi:RNA polymerase sigma-70 factor (ECF subfamily)